MRGLLSLRYTEAHESQPTTHTAGNLLSARPGRAYYLIASLFCYKYNTIRNHTTPTQILGPIECIKKTDIECVGVNISLSVEMTFSLICLYRKLDISKA